MKPIENSRLKLDRGGPGGRSFRAQMRAAAAQKQYAGVGGKRRLRLWREVKARNQIALQRLADLVERRRLERTPPGPPDRHVGTGFVDQSQLRRYDCVDAPPTLVSKGAANGEALHQPNLHAVAKQP